MNQKALLNGMEYTILDLLPSLDYSDRMVLCQNASGQKYICSKATWESHALQPRSSAAVTTHSPTSEKIKCFLSFFREGMICMPEDFIVSRPEKADIPPSAKTSGNMVCAIKKRINVRIARTGSLSP